MREQTANFQSFNWLRGVADDTRISVIHRLVLIRILIHRQKDGQCDPGYDRLRCELGVNCTTVFRAVDAAIGVRLAGFPTHGGRTKRNFVFTFPQQSQASDSSTIAPERPLQAPTVAGKHANSRRKRPQQSRAILEAPETASYFASTGQRTGKERTGSKNNTQPPDDVVASEASKQVLGEPKRKRAKKSRATAADIDPTFAEFWQAIRARFSTMPPAKHSPLRSNAVPIRRT